MATRSIRTNLQAAKTHLRTTVGQSAVYLTPAIYASAKAVEAAVKSYDSTESIVMNIAMASPAILAITLDTLAVLAAGRMIRSEYNRYKEMLRDPEFGNKKSLV